MAVDIVGRDVGARLHPRVPRPSGGRPGRARARGRRRESESRPSGLRASRPRVNEDCVSSCRGRPKRNEGSLTPASATCSRTCSSESCRSCRRRGGARSRWHSCSRTRSRRLRSAHARRRSPKRTGGSRCRGAGRACVDDVQWLDPSSASALTFALRRMGEQPVLLLLARRTGERSGDARSSSRRFETDRVERLPVGPLSLGAIHSLLQARLGRTFSRPSLLRVHETSGGNPFYALELARALGADVDPTQPLPCSRDTRGTGARTPRRAAARQHESRCCSQWPWAVRPPSSSQAWTSPSTYSIRALPRV